jgi:transcriptional regulator with XRE-family HTH domain
MVIGERLRGLREAKNLTQQDIENRSGLKRFYLSRVENGYTVPSVQTLEKLAIVLEVPIYRFFYEGDRPPEPPILPQRVTRTEEAKRYAESARLIAKLGRLLGKMDETGRSRLYSMARTMAERKRARPKRWKKETSQKRIAPRDKRFKGK